MPPHERFETFTVALSGAMGGTLLKGVGNGLILNDDSVQYEPVYGLVVVSDGDSALGRNRLQWLNPTPLPQGIRINSTHAPTSCAPPAAPGPGAWGSARPDGWDIDFGGGPANTAAHTGLILNERYCYGVWAWYGASNWSARATATGVPFDATGKVKWKYFIGMTTLSHPTVGTDAVLAPSNDNYVHAMVPGPSPADGSPGGGDRCGG